MIKFKHGREAGNWWGVRNREGYRTATITCPNCNNVQTLSGHTISKEGVVEPSVKCNTLGCGFHDFVVLEGWEKWK